MSGRTIEKDGETYIVSDDVVDLDTENLVDKDAVTKLFEAINSSNKTAQKAELSDSKPKTNSKKLAIIFDFDVDGNFVSISGQLKEAQIDNSIEYQMLVSNLDASELLKISHQKQNVVVKEISLTDNKIKTPINSGHFKLQKICINGYEDDLVVCSLELSAQ